MPNEYVGTYLTSAEISRDQPRSAEIRRDAGQDFGVRLRIWPRKWKRSRRLGAGSAAAPPRGIPSATYGEVASCEREVKTGITMSLPGSKQR